MGNGPSIRPPVRWDDGLEGAARRIAAGDGTPLRVRAGPGTGKTFALKRRVARLFENGVDPERIFVCTFTRTAARDLQQEIAGVGLPGVEDVWAGTLHAFCFRTLNRQGVLSITNRVPRLLLDFERRFLEEDLKRQEADFGGVRECRRRMEAFSAAWARLQSDDPGWPDAPIDRLFHNALESWLRFHRAMLVGEIIPETLRYLRDNPACEERDMFDYVLVDEYQDLNRAEQELVDLLAGESDYAIVGDQDQSIYSLKYAHPEGISTFGETHPGTSDEDLFDCRRCPQLVVRLANHLIRHNASWSNRPLNPWPTNPEGEVLVVQWRRREEEADGLARLVRQRVDVESELTAGDVLVLTQRRHFGYALRDRLNAVGVPAHSFFFEEALDGNPFRPERYQAIEAFTLLTLLADPEDRVALRCWSGFGSSSLNSPGWWRLRAHCEETGQSPRAALEALSEGELRIRYTDGIVERFRLLQEHEGRLVGADGEALLDAVFPQEGEWAGAIRELAFTMDEPDFDAGRLREILRRGITQPELPTDVDYVRVMSLHRSKGLSARLVVIAGCIEGVLPTLEEDLPPAEQARKLEEQRRLFYVAITRTRSTLVLSSVLRLERSLAYRIGARVQGGGRGYANTIASRFLSELGPEKPAAIRGEQIL